MSTPPRRALLVVDVQNEYVDGGLRIEHPPVQGSLARIGEAIDAARAAGVPVLVVQNTAPADFPVFAHGSHGWQLHPVVASRPHDFAFEKTLPSCFTGTALADWLKDHGIDTLAVVGYMTQNCDASTIYEATHRGLAVEFLSDASGAVPFANAAGRVSAEEVHRVFSVVFATRFAAVAGTRDWNEALAQGKPLPRDNILASNRAALAYASGQP